MVVEAVKGIAGDMRKVGLKALVTLLTAERHSKGHINWTLSIAIFSTVVTLALVVLYFAQHSSK
jgi:hypothetical protein